MSKRRARSAAARPDAKGVAAKGDIAPEYVRSKPDRLNRSINGNGFAKMLDRMAAAQREDGQQAYIEANEGAIIAALVRRAKEGDVAAAKLALDYAHPPPGTRLTPFPTLLIGGPHEAIAMMEHALSAIGIGELTIAEAERLFRLVQMYMSAYKALPKLAETLTADETRARQEKLNKERDDIRAKVLRWREEVLAKSGNGDEARPARAEAQGADADKDNAKTSDKERA